MAKIAYQRLVRFAQEFLVARPSTSTRLLPSGARARHIRDVYHRTE